MSLLKSLFLIMVTFYCGSASAVRLSDYSPYEYEVRFTNPICNDYSFSTPVEAQDGSLILRKPKNVYCKSSDMAANLGRQGTPSEKLLAWIQAPTTREIFMTYLSFSNQAVAEALCKAMKERGVEVQVVLDQGTDTARMNELKACGGSRFTHYLRGHVTGIDFAHNKLTIINPRSDSEKIQITFGSGNMTSGLVLHHENWHFITTNRKSYFAQSHLCLIQAEIDHASSRKEFVEFIKSCLSAIEAPPEEDIQVFFVPGFGNEALKSIENALQWSQTVKLASHRFSFNKLTDLLKQRLSQNATLSLLFDDDLYWVKAPNTRHENTIVRDLISSGADVRFLETNHNQKLLQHNKFIVFSGAGKKAAFVGAGNFTGTAFTSNWENFYFVQIPEIVEKMDQQFDYLYGQLATPLHRLPRQDRHP